MAEAEAARSRSEGSEAPVPEVGAEAASDCSPVKRPSSMDRRSGRLLGSGSKDLSARSTIRQVISHTITLIDGILETVFPSRYSD